MHEPMIVKLPQSLSVEIGGKMSIHQFRAKVDYNRSKQDRLAAVRAEAPDRTLAGLQRLEMRVQELIRLTPELKAYVSANIYAGQIPYHPEDDWGYKYYSDDMIPPRLSIIAFSRITIISLIYNPYTNHWFKLYRDDHHYDSEQSAYDDVMVHLAEWVANYPKHLEEDALASKRVQTAKEAVTKEQYKKIRDQTNKQLISVVIVALFALLIYLW
jgi:hypothetical protein